MKYYIIAGEASGDLHGSNLIKALHRKDTQADIRCWGGDRMEEAGATLVKHYRDLAYMGFVEVIKHLGAILNNIKYCKADILKYNPDVLVLIDYPGHIVCSSLSRSEIVVPLLRNGEVIGVLDVDSADYNQFDEVDKVYLEQIAGMLKTD